MEIKAKDLSQPEFDALALSFEKDLSAWAYLIQAEAMILLQRAADEEWSVETYMQHLDAIMDGTEESALKPKARGEVMKGSMEPMAGPGAINGQPSRVCQGDGKEAARARIIKALKVAKEQLATYGADELSIGTAHEAAEHGLDEVMARKIANDHLKEHPDYYSRLKAAGLL